jgi:hypothetical protein
MEEEGVTLDNGWEVRDGNRNVFAFENPGDSIEGELTRIRNTQYGLAYDIDNEDGMHTIWGSTVLDSRLSAKDIGRMVRITFKGMKLGQNRREYKDFEVLVKKEPIAE